MKTNFTNRSFAPRRGARAFTLVEMLLVLAILALLAGIIYPNMTKRAEAARIATAKAQIAALTSALQLFAVDNGSFPKGRDGLNQLLQRPANASNWNGPYVEKTPLDPWKGAYIFEFPGKHRPASFDLMSPGPDGQAGTADDVTNWD